MGKFIHWDKFRSMVSKESLWSLSPVFQFIEKRKTNPIALLGNRKELEFASWYLELFDVKVSGAYNSVRELADSSSKDTLVISAKHYEPLYIKKNRLMFLQDSAQLRAYRFNNCCALPSYIQYDKGLCLSEILENGLEQIEHTYGLFSDDISRSTFLNILLLRMTGNESFIPIAEYPQYLHPKMTFPNNPIIIDGGAYDGDTAVILNDATSNRSTIYSFEPTKSTYELLIKNIENAGIKNQVIPLNTALWSHPGTITFTENEDVSSNNIFEGGKIIVPTTSIDSFFTDNNLKRIDFIKLDVEGAEPEAIIGSSNTIVQNNPLLAICVYHHGSHLWTIPQQIKKINPNYNLYLGHHHPKLIYETVMYAI